MSSETYDHAAEEPRVEAYFVKVNDSQAGVVVSFYDAGEEDPAGIYLYEPGADPVELDTVGISDIATEFEYAIVETGRRVDSTGTRLSYAPANHGFEEREYPGDGLVTFAQRDADVAAAVEEHETLTDNHEKLTAQARNLVDAAEKFHGLSHSGAFQWCQADVCTAARAVDL